LLKARCRFATLREAIPDITDRMLSERLQELEQEGVVERTVVPESPIRVEYSLTKKGRALAAVVDAVADWAHKWVSEAPAAKPARGRRSA
jgi:DNA-binding HxlR family transcriptional regulator